MQSFPSSIQKNGKNSQLIKKLIFIIHYLVSIPSLHFYPLFLSLFNMNMTNVEKQQQAVQRKKIFVSRLHKQAHTTWEAQNTLKRE